MIEEENDMVAGEQRQLAEWLDNIIGKDLPYASNRELASASGLAPNSIRKYRLGHVPTLKSLQKLADGTGYSVEELRLRAVDEFDEKRERTEELKALANILERLSPSSIKHLLSLAVSLKEQELEKETGGPDRKSA